jgi:hypothetical protein
MIYQHGIYTLDLSNSSKSKLYQFGRLYFVGDGYRAITMFIRATDNDPNVVEKFSAQLAMRQKPKFPE